MITSWDQLPLILGVKDMAALLGCQRSTIWKRLESKRMRPKPVRWSRPYQWYREHVRAEFERGPVLPARTLSRLVVPSQPVPDLRDVTRALLQEAES